MSRFTLYLTLLLVPVLSMAQADKLLRKLRMDSTSFGHKVMLADSILTRSYNKGNYDTTYIRRPRHPFTVKVRYNVSGSGIYTKGQIEGHDYRSRLTTSYQNTASLAFAYRGIAVAFAVNPAKLFGKDKSKSFNFTLYANRYGMDLAYQDSRQYSGWGEYDGVRETFTTDIVRTRLTDMNAYYAFNYRKFSYPAALTQSYIQQRSAGSWLLALSCLNGNMEMSKSEVDDRVPEVNLRLLDIGVGGGYGYNLCLPHRWMIHASVLPTIIVGPFNKMTVEGEKHHIKYSFPEFIVTERLSFLHYINDRNFLNLTFVNYSTIQGNYKNIRNVHNKWRLRVCYGMRF